MGTTSRMLLALGTGVVAGLLLTWIDPASATRAAGAVQPIGRLWLNALQMTVVPLVPPRRPADERPPGSEDVRGDN